MSIFGKCSLKSALSFVIEERHDLRDHLVGSFLHQPVTEPCTTVPDTLVATSFAWLMRNVPDAFSGATQYFPQARIVFDKFHVTVLAGQALDRPAPGCPGHRFLRAILEKHAPSDIGRQSLAAVLYNTHIDGPLDALPCLGAPALASSVPSASGHNFTVL
jgi:hypothetical protein